MTEPKYKRIGMQVWDVESKTLLADTHDEKGRVGNLITNALNHCDDHERSEYEGVLFTLRKDIARKMEEVERLNATAAKYQAALKTLSREWSLETRAAGHAPRCACHMCASFRRVRILLGTAR